MAVKPKEEKGKIQAQGPHPAEDGQGAPDELDEVLEGSQQGGDGRPGGTEKDDEPPSWAKGLTDRLDSIESRQQAQTQQPRQVQQQRPQQKDQFATYAQDLFVNPEGTLRRMYTDVRREVMSEFQSVNQQQQGVQQFYEDFYRDNNHLRRIPQIVEGVLSDNFNAWAPLKPAEAREKLAKAVESHILDSTKVLNGGKGLPNTINQLESGQGPQGSGSLPEEGTTPKPKTTSVHLRERAERRRRAS